VAKGAVSGLGTADIAVYAGCSAATVTKLPRGGHTPEFDVLYAKRQRKPLDDLSAAIAAYWAPGVPGGSLPGDLESDRASEMSGEG